MPFRSCHALNFISDEVKLQKILAVTKEDFRMHGSSRFSLAENRNERNLIHRVNLSFLVRKKFKSRQAERRVKECPFEAEIQRFV